MAGAFAHSIAPVDDFDSAKADAALRMLGQDPSTELICVYCTKPAQTWDHLLSIVKDGEFRGYGHQLGNLVPCCKDCNSGKGGKSFEDFIIQSHGNNSKSREKIKLLESYSQMFARFVDNSALDKSFPAEIMRYREIRSKIYKLMQEADVIAHDIRAKTKGSMTGTTEFNQSV